MAFTLFACWDVLQEHDCIATEQEDTVAPPCVVAQSEVKGLQKPTYPIF